mgnify:CR=1 FL=1
MNLWKKLWTDEVGVILSAETVMLGTIGVLAMTAGVGVMGSAMNEELADVSRAFRSFDQSFQVTGYRVDSTFGDSTSSSSASDDSSPAALAMKTGSGFQQESAQEAVSSLTMHPMAAQVVAATPNIVAQEEEVAESGVSKTSEKSQAELQKELKQLLQEYARLQAQQQAAAGTPAKSF